MKKSRTQLYLSERQKKRLRDLSQKAGKSIGQLVREAVDEVYLKAQPPEKPLSKRDPLWNFVGGGRVEESDVSSHHDLYLYRTKT
ncbi:MAG: ribbon-helix-helix protein, CopG family [Acidobacteriota bacterium]